MKRKNHSASLRRVRHHRAMVKQYHLGILYSYNHKQLSHLINIRNGNQVSATPLIIDALRSITYNWSVLIAALCVDDNGREYIKSEQVDAKEPYLQSDLMEVLDMQHRALLMNCNQNHLINAVWLATPYEHDWDESHAAKLLSDFGAWDEPTVLE